MSFRRAKIKDKEYGEIIGKDPKKNNIAKFIGTIETFYSEADEIRKIKDEIDRLKEKIEDYDTILSEHKELLGGIKSEISDLEEEIRQSKSDMKTAEQQYLDAKAQGNEALTKQREETFIERKNTYRIKILERELKYARKISFDSLIRKYTIEKEKLLKDKDSKEKALRKLIGIETADTIESIFLYFNIKLKKDNIEKAYISLKDDYDNLEKIETDIQNLNKKFDEENFVKYLEKNKKTPSIGDSSSFFTNYYIDLKNISCHKKNRIFDTIIKEKDKFRIDMLVEFDDERIDDIRDGILVNIKGKSSVDMKDIKLQMRKIKNNFNIFHSNYYGIGKTEYYGSLEYRNDITLKYFIISIIRDDDRLYIKINNESIGPGLKIDFIISDFFIGDPKKNSMEMKIHRIVFDTSITNNNIFNVPSNFSSVIQADFEDVKTFSCIANIDEKCILFHMHKENGIYKFYKDFNKIESDSSIDNISKNKELNIFFNKIRKNIKSDRFDDSGLFCNNYLLIHMPEMKIYSLKLHKHKLSDLDLYKNFKEYCEDKITLNICDSTVLTENDKNNNIKIKFLDMEESNSFILDCENTDDINDDKFKIFLKKKKDYLENLVKTDLDSCKGEVSKVKMIDDDKITEELIKIINEKNDPDITLIQEQKFFLNNQCKLGFIDANSKEYIYDTDCKEGETCSSEAGFRKIGNKELVNSPCTFFPLLCEVYYDTSYQIKIVKGNYNKYTELITDEQKILFQSNLEPINYLELELEYQDSIIVKKI